MSAAFLDRTVPIDRTVARKAAEWLMRLGDDNVSAADIAACERWRAASQEHERAWQRAQQVTAQLGSIPARISMTTLTRAGASRRDAMKTMLVLLMTAGPATWLTAEITPWREWSAGVRTATGERRQLTLPDGSSLHLNTASAVDVNFDDRERRVILRGGEILIETAADPTRPFRVQTAHGMLRALGTRFTVRDRGEHCRVAVYDGAVEISPRNGGEPAVLSAGSQRSFDSNAIARIETIDTHGTGWSRGLLHADRMPLGDFLAEVSRHRRGLLRCDPAVATLRISGIYQLGETDAILDALPGLLPVRVRRHNNYWLVVEAAG